jgi:hypothetical protein
MSARYAAPSLDSSLSSGHDVQVAVSIGVLTERFYGELWNRWNDSAVEDTLSLGLNLPRVAGAGDIGNGQGWRRYRAKMANLPGAARRAFSACPLVDLVARNMMPHPGSHWHAAAQVRRDSGELLMLPCHACVVMHAAGIP